jgi:aryl-alcohol dehydrogenase-like predicted oxidoreductase
MTHVEFPLVLVVASEKGKVVSGKSSRCEDWGDAMDKLRFASTELDVSAIVLGTWVTGGWMWGGADELDSIRTIHRALDLGINFIDTAPVYGFGRSEEVIGRALRERRDRDGVVVATKGGLEWDAAQRQIRRNSSPARIRQEVDDSLRRLRRDHIDLYQIHWPDLNTPFEDSMTALLELRDVGKIRHIGLSNFNRNQITDCLRVAPVQSLQPPFNLFEQDAAKELLPFCLENGIGTLVYGGLCRGLLSGKFTGKETFPKGDLRRADPKFKPDRFRQYVKAVDELKKIATKYGRSMGQFALRWALQQPGVTTVIAGARTPQQVEDNAGASGWLIAEEDLRRVDLVLAKFIKTPVGPEFMAPGP